MTVNDLRLQIMHKELRQFYVFTGDEYKVREIYLKKMADAIQGQIERIESVSECRGQESSLFSTKKLYVCTDDKTFLKAEKAWDKVEEFIGDSTLILVYNDLDKRTKFYKYFKDVIISFDALTDAMLLKYLRDELEAGDYTGRWLARICCGSYGRLLLECDKVRQYADAEGIAQEQALKTLLETGVIHTPPEDAIFDYTAAVLRGDRAEAYRLLEDCRALGEPALRLLLVLYRAVRNTLQVNSCESADVEAVTGLSQWEVKQARSYKSSFPNVALVGFLNIISETEQNIKRGLMPDDLAVDYVMQKIFSEI